jgi:hypothetical protein
MTEINERLAPRKQRIVQRKQRIVQQRGVVKKGALDPILQSALGIVRESAGLLWNVARFGIVLISEPKKSHPRATKGPDMLGGLKSGNVIPFSPTRNVRPPG